MAASEEEVEETTAITTGTTARREKIATARARVGAEAEVARRRENLKREDHPQIAVDLIMLIIVHICC